MNFEIPATGQRPASPNTSPLSSDRFGHAYTPATPAAEKQSELPLQRAIKLHDDVGLNSTRWGRPYTPAMG